MDNESKQLLEEKRGRLITHKSFLRSLITTPTKVEKVLIDADNAELNILLELLHWFARGEIAINKKLHKRLEDSTIATIFRRNIVHQTGFKKLLLSKRSKKVDLLTTLKTVIPLFLKHLKTT